MPDLKNQRRMAAEILKCGVHRVFIRESDQAEVANAVTRSDVRKLISGGAIYAKPRRGTSHVRARYRKRQRSSGKRKGHGKRRGSTYARFPRKRMWIKTIRPIRTYLRTLRDDGLIERRTYRLFYRQAKGGMFKNKAHVEQQLKLKGLLKEEIKKKKKKKRRAKAKRAKTVRKKKPKKKKKVKKKEETEKE